MEEEKSLLISISTLYSEEAARSDVKSAAFPLNNEPLNLAWFWRQVSELLWGEQLQNQPSSKKKSWVETIDSSTWFYGFYGLLDGLSVVYSTIKFSCELISKDKDEYNQNLETVLTDHLFWLPLVFIATASFLTLSIVGSYTSKVDKDKRLSVESLLKAWLPYIRDFLKAGKNGYKAIKTFVVVLAHQQLLNAKNIRSIALPIGLVFSIAAVINRYCIRLKTDKQKKMIDDSDALSKQLSTAAELQRKYLILQTELFDLLFDSERFKVDLINRRGRAFSQERTSNLPNPQRKKELTVNELNAHEDLNDSIRPLVLRKKAEMKALRKAMSKINLGKLHQKQQKIAIKADAFLEETYFSLLFSKALGGLIDAPYLYFGVLSLGLLSMPAFIFTTSILSVFLVACIAVRYHEGLLLQRELKAKTTHAQLKLAMAEFNEAQSAVLALNLQHFNAFKNRRYKGVFDNDEMLKQYEIDKSHEKSAAYREAVGKAYDKTLSLYYKVEKISDELKDIIQPSYQSEILNGMQDGLSAFGALASTYFLGGIFCLLLGVNFPVALITGGAIFGLVAIATFVYKRVQTLKINLQDLDNYYTSWKSHINERIFYNREEVLLSPLDCNTDGLTKGEFFFQTQFEIVRCFTSGPYKAQNLKDFILNGIDDHFSNFIIVFWVLLAAVETAVLTARAVAQAPKEKPKTKSGKDVSIEKELDSNPSTNDSAKKPPTVAPKGAICPTFSFFKPKKEVEAEFYASNTPAMAG